MTLKLFTAFLRPLAMAGLPAMALALACPAGAQTAPPGQTTANGEPVTFPDVRPGITVPNRPPIPNFRDYYRDTVTALADYARGRKPNFIVLTREGLGLLLKSPREAKLEDILHPAVTDPSVPAVPRIPIGAQQRRFIRAIDGVVMDGQYCGKTVSASDGYITMMRNAGLSVLSVDHCETAKAAGAAWLTARKQGILAHADAQKGPLGIVPAGTEFGENQLNITTLAEARNLLVVDDNAGYASKTDLLKALGGTNSDVLVIDAFHRDRTSLTPAEVHALKFKHLGARRLVLARLDISHASDTRWYWKEEWIPGQPDWLIAPVLDTPGTYEAAVWAPEWRAIIGRTMSGLMDLGFDGVVIEGIDTYQILEARTPLD